MLDEELSLKNNFKDFTNQEIEIIKDFKKLFYTEENEFLLSEEDWESISLGFMVGKGIEIERAFEISGLVDVYFEEYLQIKGE